LGQQHSGDNKYTAALIQCCAFSLFAMWIVHTNSYTAPSLTALGHQWHAP